MATTKIWAVKSRVDHVLEYAENKDKTRNDAWSEVDYQSMRDVMDYAMNDAKTEKQYYVSGINCSPDTARREMQGTKYAFGKEDGILAFHGYQSFKPGEVTPDLAHEIGIKLAEELWPDHQVIVATHLDKEHIHSHFVVNSVSLHGRKFYATKASYRQMRAASDRLCKEYGLSVITEHQEYYPKHYAEWDAEQNGQPTWRSSIKVDIDEAIKYSMTFQQFISEMKKKGYVLERRGSFLRIKAPGMQRFVRLRSLGAGKQSNVVSCAIGIPKYLQEKRFLIQERSYSTAISACRRLHGKDYAHCIISIFVNFANRSASQSKPYRIVCASIFVISMRSLSSPSSSFVTISTPVNRSKP